jgi:putative oxygen-independent coproporphyrinogen III oxidase
LSRSATESSDGEAGLYLHIPFCSAICPYCDFSVLLGDAARRRGFTAGLTREASLWSDAPLGFDSVYLGGGTPSALAPEQLGEILQAIRGHLTVAQDAHLFLEANPEDVTVEALAAWRGLGVETLSLGIQSFRDEALRFLGRRHGPKEGRRAVEAALGAGFRTVSVDLIFGLPEQTPELLRGDLEAVVALAPQHVSCYQLTIHEGTPFGFRKARGTLSEMPEDGQGELFLLTHSFLADHGYQAYEVSNFARGPEHQSRHNRKYWSHSPYLGLGPSAHSFDGHRRWWNRRKLGPWLEAVEAGERPVEGEEALSPQELTLEALMLGLRTADGVDLERIRRRWAIDLLPANEALIEDLAAQGLLVPRGSTLVPTLAGWAVADGLARRFDF